MYQIITVEIVSIFCFRLLLQCGHCIRNANWCTVISVNIIYFILRWTPLFQFIFHWFNAYLSIVNQYVLYLSGSLVHYWCFSSCWSWTSSCPWFSAWRLRSCVCEYFQLLTVNYGFFVHFLNWCGDNMEKVWLSSFLACRTSLKSMV